jgi:hypothetical protein
MSLADDVTRALDEPSCEWLTVKEFAARYRMSERGVRDAIRDGHLNPEYRVERPSKRTVRIAVPRRAA